MVSVQPVNAYKRGIKMKKSLHLNWIIIVLALIFGITACASNTGGTKGSTRGKLKRLKINKESELRRN